MSSDSQLAERLAFLRIDATTRAILTEFLPTLQRALPDILAGFYQHIRRHPDLARMFKGDAAMERAGKAQSEHWVRLFSARFDDAYVNSVRAIGLMHSRIGLEPRWYIGGYGFIIGHLYAAASLHNTSRLNPVAAAARTAELLRALNQVIMLDMDLAISTYIEENKASYDAKLARLADEFRRQVAPHVDSLTTQAGNLTETAALMSTTASETSRQAAIVAAAAEESSVNVQTVATATEELHASVDEISRQVGHSAQISNAAAQAAEATNATVQGLSDAAQKIGDVVKLISDIAAQTNLLALNATIEAARAGDAGKGFAVVAAEVKGLAGQTARATEGIAAQVGAIQTATRDAVEAIQGITGTIGRMSEISTAIASSVDQQNAATQEIARSVQEVSASTREVSSNIAGVHHAAEETGTASGQLTESADALARSGDALRTQVDGFLRELRAA